MKIHAKLKTQAKGNFCIVVAGIRGAISARVSSLMKLWDHYGYKCNAYNCTYYSSYFINKDTYNVPNPILHWSVFKAN